MLAYLGTWYDDPQRVENYIHLPFQFVPHVPHFEVLTTILFAVGVFASRQPPAGDDVHVHLGPFSQSSEVWHALHAGIVKPSAILGRAIQDLMECNFTFYDEDSKELCTRLVHLHQDWRISDLRQQLQLSRADCLLGWDNDNRRLAELGWMEGSKIELTLKTILWAQKENATRYMRLLQPDSTLLYLRNVDSSRKPQSLSYAHSRNEWSEQRGLRNEEVVQRILDKARGGGIALVMTPSQFYPDSDVRGHRNDQMSRQSSAASSCSVGSNSSVTDFTEGAN